MKKTISILFALALVLSFSLVTTTAVAAATFNVPSGTYPTIQSAIDAANPAGGDTIIVAAGTYAGAVVDRQVTIVGAAGGGSVITSGVPYAAPTHSLTTAFRLDAGADGAEIRDFTVNCAVASGFYFAVFGRAVSDVIVDSLIVSSPVQGITNWGGSNWQITNNKLDYTEASGGGGIGIMLGATPPLYRVCSGNVVSGNIITVTATAPDYSSPGILVALDVRWGRYNDLDGTEDVSGNQVIGNTIIGNDGLNSVGIEAGVIFGTTPPDSTQIAATLGIVHDTMIQGNTISDVDMGLYLYTVTGLRAEHNDISACSLGVAMYDGNQNNTINFNSIYENTTFGFYNDTGVAVDATLNWWGHASGPYHATLNPSGAANAVSNNVVFDPWVGKTESVTPVTGGTASFTPSWGVVEDLTATAAPSLPSVSFPHGMFNFKITGLTPGQTVTLTIELPAPVPVGTVWWKYDNGRWHSLPNLNDNGNHIMQIQLTDGGTGDSDSIAGQITDPGGPGNPMTVGWDGSPVSKASVLAPWIALLAAIMVGASMLVTRRRRVEI